MAERKPRNYTYISLFCGCGGFDQGFTKKGFKCLGAYDIDPNVIKVHQNNIPGPAFVHDLLENDLPGNIKPGSVDVVISGSPCQGFSTVGRRKINDPRNKLLMVGGEIAIKLNTKVFVAENVMGSASGRHKKYWNKLIRLLNSNGYNTEVLCCNATDLGLPQLRKRVILIAWRGDKRIDLKLPKLIPRPLREILEGVEGAANHTIATLCPTSEIYKIAKQISPSQKLSNVRGGERSVHTWDIPDVFGPVNSHEKELLLKIMRLRRQNRIRRAGDADPVPLATLERECTKSISPIVKSLLSKGYIREQGNECYDLVHTFNGKFRRLSWDGYSPTVDTRFGSPRYFLHPEEHRGFTPREAARIQGFDDDFVFSGSIDQQFTMIGNAVPPPMAEAIAELIKRKIFQ